jgi:hypothetical protein
LCSCLLLLLCVHKGPLPPMLACGTYASQGQYAGSVQTMYDRPQFYKSSSWCRLHTAEPPKVLTAHGCLRQQLLGLSMLHIFTCVAYVCGRSLSPTACHAATEKSHLYVYGMLHSPPESELLSLSTSPVWGWSRSWLPAGTKRAGHILTK